MFAEILEKCDIVTTPGSGFGPGGEPCARPLSAPAVGCPRPLCMPMGQTCLLLEFGSLGWRGPRAEHAAAAAAPAGEGFVRASAFGHRENILEAVERFKKVYGKK